MKKSLKRLFQIYILKLVFDLETFKEYLNNYGINLELVKNKFQLKYLE